MVYFVCRSEYESPHGRRIVEFPDAANLLDWFQQHWLTREDIIAIEPGLAEEAEMQPWDWEEPILELREKLFRGSFYGLSDLFFPMIDRPSPKTLLEVEEFIESFEGRYSEGSIKMNETSIQANTNDDEIEIAWYLFDDAFAKRFPERSAFLLHKPFELPSKSKTTGWLPPVPTKTIRIGNEGGFANGDKEGSTFCCFFSAQDGETISDVEGCYRIPSRLPNLGKWLASVSLDATPKEYRDMAPDWPMDLVLLRAFAILAKDHSFEEALRSFEALHSEICRWLPYYYSDGRKKPLFLLKDSKLVEDRINQFRSSTLKSGEKNPNRIDTAGETKLQFTKHLCQASFTITSRAKDDPTCSHENNKHWIFFDDLWASANRPMAESILRYGSGVNVLGG